MPTTLMNFFKKIATKLHTTNYVHGCFLSKTIHVNFKTSFLKSEEEEAHVIGFHEVCELFFGLCSK
jgi:hypothetical protein